MFFFGGGWTLLHCCILRQFSGYIICTHDRRMWISMWMGNCISTTSLVCMQIIKISRLIVRSLVHFND